MENMDKGFAKKALHVTSIMFLMISLCSALYSVLCIVSIYSAETINWQIGASVLYGMLISSVLGLLGVLGILRSSGRKTGMAAMILGALTVLVSLALAPEGLIMTALSLAYTIFAMVLTNDGKAAETEKLQVRDTRISA